MTDDLAFEAAIQPMVWGRSTATVLRLPAAIATALAAQGAKRVEGEINDHPVNLALSRAPVIEDVFRRAGQSLLDRIGIVPGQPLEVRLRPAPDDRVDLPDDIATGLRAAGAMVAWQALTPGKRRGLIYKIDTARTAATRANRIGAFVQDLTA